MTPLPTLKFLKNLKTRVKPEYILKIFKLVLLGLLVPYLWSIHSATSSISYDSGQVVLDSYVRGFLRIFPLPFIDKLFFELGLYKAISLLTYVFFFAGLYRFLTVRKHGILIFIILISLPSFFFNQVYHHDFYVYKITLSYTLLLWSYLLFEKKIGKLFLLIAVPLSFFFRPVHLLLYMAFACLNLTKKNFLFYLSPIAIFFIINFFLWGNPLESGENYKYHFMIQDHAYQQFDFSEYLFKESILSSTLKSLSCYMQMTPDLSYNHEYLRCNPSQVTAPTLLFIWPLIFLLFEKSLLSISLYSLFLIAYSLLAQDINYRYILDITIFSSLLTTLGPLRSKVIGPTILLTICLYALITTFLSSKSITDTKVNINTVTQRPLKQNHQYKCSQLGDDTAINGLYFISDGPCYLGRLAVMVIQKDKKDCDLLINTNTPIDCSKAEVTIGTKTKTALQTNSKQCKINLLQEFKHQLILVSWPEKIQNQTELNNFTVPTQYELSSLNISCP